jgi:hypothetical protein
VNSRGLFLENAVEAHKLLKQANGEGRHLLAVEIGEEIIANRTFGDAVPVQQQMARALAILGSCAEALAILEKIPTGRSDAAETLGLLARVWKDLAAEAEEPEERERCFRESLRCYSEGFDLAEKAGDPGGAAYCGINAAAVAVWLGETASALDFAGKSSAYSESDSSYYGIATRAEAALILGRGDEAAVLYRQASEIGEAEKRWADIASTRKQCRALCLKLHGRRDPMDASFSLGAVAVISCEAPGEASEEIISGVRERVAAWLHENGIRHAFLEDNGGWNLIPAGLAIETYQITPNGSGAASRRFMHRMIAARGALLASHLGVPLKALTIGDKPAATAASDWQKAGLAPYAIFPGRSEPDGVPDPDVAAAPVPFPRTLAGGVEKEQVLALLHLHFSDRKAPGKAALDLLAARLTASDHPPICTQGHGGDYVFAFHGLRHAAVTALSFMEALEQGDCALPSICLHAGLVEMDVNPLLHLYAPDGETVSRCGDIAALMPPGAVCATEPFTALCALESVRGFRFSHSGTIETEGGTNRLFHVHSTAKP